MDFVQNIKSYFSRPPVPKVPDHQRRPESDSYDDFVKGAKALADLNDGAVDIRASYDKDGKPTGSVYFSLGQLKRGTHRRLTYYLGNLRLRFPEKKRALKRAAGVAKAKQLFASKHGSARAEAIFERAHQYRLDEARKLGIEPDKFRDINKHLLASDVQLLEEVAQQLAAEEKTARKRQENAIRQQNLDTLLTWAKEGKLDPIIDHIEEHGSVPHPKFADADCPENARVWKFMAATLRECVDQLKNGDRLSKERTIFFRAFLRGIVHHAEQDHGCRALELHDVQRSAEQTVSMAPLWVPMSRKANLQKLSEFCDIDLISSGKKPAHADGAGQPAKYTKSPEKYIEALQDVVEVWYQHLLDTRGADDITRDEVAWLKSELGRLCGKVPQGDKKAEKFEFRHDEEDLRQLGNEMWKAFIKDAAKLKIAVGSADRVAQRAENFTGGQLVLDKDIGRWHHKRFMRLIEIRRYHLECIDRQNDSEDALQSRLTYLTGVKGFLTGTVKRDQLPGCQIGATDSPAKIVTAWCRNENLFAALADRGVDAPAVQRMEESLSVIDDYGDFRNHLAELKRDYGDRLEGAPRKHLESLSEQAATIMRKRADLMALSDALKSLDQKSDGKKIKTPGMQGWALLQYVATEINRNVPAYQNFKNIAADHTQHALCQLPHVQSMFNDHGEAAGLTLNDGAGGIVVGTLRHIRPPQTEQAQPASRSRFGRRKRPSDYTQRSEYKKWQAGAKVLDDYAAFASDRKKLGRIEHLEHTQRYMPDVMNKELKSELNGYHAEMSRLQTELARFEKQNQTLKKYFKNNKEFGLTKPGEEFFNDVDSAVKLARTRLKGEPIADANALRKKRIRLSRKAQPALVKRVFPYIPKITLPDRDHLLNTDIGVSAIENAVLVKSAKRDITAENTGFLYKLYPSLQLFNENLGGLLADAPLTTKDFLNLEGDIEDFKKDVARIDKLNNSLTGLKETIAQAKKLKAVPDDAKERIGLSANADLASRKKEYTDAITRLQKQLKRIRTQCEAAESAYKAYKDSQVPAARA